MILDTEYPLSLLTEWFSPNTHVPKCSGFYEVHAGLFGEVAWYEADEGAFYTLAGLRLNTAGSSNSFVWRGCVESIGRRRRSIVAN